MPSPDLKARIIIFDGVCNVCSGWVRFLEHHRIDPPFKLIPMQTDEGKALLIEYGIDPEDPTTFLVLDRGHNSRNRTAPFISSPRLAACGLRSKQPE
jgi:predicted DCC family thiol-disulfide oxidoreductase YuxK